MTDFIVGASSDLKQKGSSKHGMRSAIRLRLSIFVLIVAGSATGIWSAVRHQATVKKTDQTALSTAALDGSWIVKPASTATDQPLIASEVVDFHNGSIKGETTLQTDDDLTDTALPFPDQSVDRVKMDGVSSQITALWHGTYHLDGNHKLSFEIGTYSGQLSGKLDPKTGQIELDKDFLVSPTGKMDLVKSSHSYVTH